MPSWKKSCKIFQDDASHPFRACGAPLLVPRGPAPRVSALKSAARRARREPAAIHSGGATKEAPGPGTSSESSPKKRRRKVLSLAAVAVALFAGSFYWWYTKPKRVAASYLKSVFSGDAENQFHLRGPYGYGDLFAFGLGLDWEAMNAKAKALLRSSKYRPKYEGLSEEVRNAFRGERYRIREHYSVYGASDPPQTLLLQVHRSQQVVRR